MFFSPARTTVLTFRAVITRPINIKNQNYSLMIATNDQLVSCTLHMVKDLGFVLSWEAQFLMYEVLVGIRQCIRDYIA